MGANVQRAVQFANPVSGEVLTLDAPDADLGRYLSDLREFESVLREHKKMVTRELVSRFDRRAKWTHHVENGLTLSAPSPAPVEEFDALALREDLLKLVDEGAVTIEAVDAAVEAVVTYKVRKPGLNALRKLPHMRAVIERHARSNERERYVTVTVNHG